MIKHIKKLLPLPVIAVMMLLLQVVCSAAFTTGIDVESTAVAPGDIFKVNINIPSLPDADTASLRVEFDKSAFTVLEWHPILSGGLTETPYGDGYFAVVSANAERNIKLDKGMTLTATMKVNSGAANGNHVFRLAKHDLSYYDEVTNTIQELWTSPEVDQVSVGIANGDSGLGLTRNTVNRGETFTLNIYIPKCEKADTASVMVEYDQADFELKKWSPEISGGEVGRGDGFFSLSAANRYRDIDLTNGLVLKAEFAVKSGAATGEHKFRLVKSSMSYYSDELQNVVEMWAPNKKEVSLVVTIPTTTTTTSPRTPVTTVLTTPNYGYNTYTGYTGYSGNTTSRITTGTSVTSRISNADTTSPLPEDTDDPDDTTKRVSPYPGEETSRITSRRTTRTSTTTKPSYPYGGSDDEQIQLRVDSTLKGLPKSKITVSTKYRFFPTSTVIKLRNTDNTEKYAQSALKALGMSNHPYYAMDISLYSMSSGAPVDLSGADAYIDFLMPIPTALFSNGADISVYHIENGVPTRTASKVEYIDGEYKLGFTGKTFSPYMLVDTANENIVTNQGAYIDNRNGSLNPNTGVAAAIAIPAAVAGCVLLAKSSRHRKRAKRAVDQDDEKKK